MAACEICWTEASRKSLLGRGATADLYKIEVAAHPEHEALDRVAEAIHYALGRDDYGVANAEERAEMHEVAKAALEAAAKAGKRELRVHYHYGVNSGRETGMSVDGILEYVTRQTQGPVHISKVEERTTLLLETEWSETSER